MDEMINKVKTGAIKVKDSAQKFTKVAVFKTKSAIEEKKCQFTISGIENKIKDILVQLGNVIYDEFENGAEFEENINSKCEQIQELKKDIQELKIKIAEIKNSTACPNCQNPVSEEHDFCPKCGTKM